MIEAETFEKIFKTYFTPLCNIAFGIVKDEDVAKDVVQYTFIKVWNKREIINIEKSENVYLKRAVINTALNYIEENKKRTLHEDIEKVEYNENRNNVDESISFTETENSVKNAISELSPKCQVVFSLSRFSEMKNSEIASYLNISDKAVEKHISKALKFLRERLKPFLGDTVVIIYFIIRFLTKSI